MFRAPTAQINVAYHVVRVEKEKRRQEVEVTMLAMVQQKLPVGETLLYFNAKVNDPIITQGQPLYCQLVETITLNVVKHQAGGDPSAVAFCKSLDCLRVDQISIEDWQLLSTRVQTQITDGEKAEFDETIRVFGTKERVFSVQPFQASRP
jgi:nicotinic acid phosphoribosyltransferase